MFIVYLSIFRVKMGRVNLSKDQNCRMPYSATQNHVFKIVSINLTSRHCTRTMPGPLAAVREYFDEG